MTHSGTRKGTAYDNELESLSGEPARQDAAYRCGTIVVLGSHRLYTASWRWQGIYIAGIAPHQPGQLRHTFNPVRHGDDETESRRHQGGSGSAKANGPASHGIDERCNDVRNQ